MSSGDNLTPCRNFLSRASSDTMWPPAECPQTKISLALYLPDVSPYVFTHLTLSATSVMWSGWVTKGRSLNLRKCRLKHTAKQAVKCSRNVSRPISNAKPRIPVTVRAVKGEIFFKKVMEYNLSSKQTRIQSTINEIKITAEATDWTYQCGAMLKPSRAKNPKAKQASMITGKMMIPKDISIEAKSSRNTQGKPRRLRRYEITAHAIPDLANARPTFQ